MLPSSQRVDFQDLAQWRGGVIATLLQAEAAHDRPVIVAMSIVRDDYFEFAHAYLTAATSIERHHAPAPVDMITIYGGSTSTPAHASVDPRGTPDPVGSGGPSCPRPVAKRRPSFRT